MGSYWVEIADAVQTQRQIQFLKSQLKRGGYVLDVACGSGRHTIPLAAAGFEVVGLDVSMGLLRIAKKRGADALVRADMRYLPFKTAAFNSALSMDTSLGYLPSEADDAESLAEIKRVLQKEGGLLVDVFNRERLLSKYLGKTPTSKWLEYPSFRLEQKRSISEDGCWLRDEWTVHDRASGQIRVFRHAVRLYSCQQLERLIAEAGFSVKMVFGDYLGQQFSPETPRLILLAHVAL